MDWMEIRGWMCVERFTGISWAEMPQISLACPLPPSLCPSLPPSLPLSLLPQTVSLSPSLPPPLCWSASSPVWQLWQVVKSTHYTRQSNPLQANKQLIISIHKQLTQKPGGGRAGERVEGGGGVGVGFSRVQKLSPSHSHIHDTHTHTHIKWVRLPADFCLQQRDYHLNKLGGMNYGNECDFYFFTKKQNKGNDWTASVD